MNTKMTVRDLTYVALSAALIAICSWISIPTTVPFTLQTFAVFCVLALLGGKRGTLAVLVYILLGAVGMPVFAGFTGGVGILFGTTGGYIVGFLLSGLIYWLCEKITDNRLAKLLACVVGLAVCYAFGTVWFMNVYARNSGPIGAATALGWCVFPFVVPDLVKLVLAFALADRLKKALKW